MVRWQIAKFASKAQSALFVESDKHADELTLLQCVMSISSKTSFSSTDFGKMMKELGLCPAAVTGKSVRRNCRIPSVYWLR